MNRLMTRLIAFAAALIFVAGCDDGASTEPSPPPAQPAAPDAPEPPGAFIGVSADARACEVMLFDPEGQLGAPVLGAAVEGRSLRRGDRLALAFAHRENAPIAAGAIGLVVAAGGDGVQLESATCFGAQGRPLADAEAALEAI